MSEAIREVGGFLEMESYSGPMLHSESLALNSGRNALAYVLKAYDIKKLYIPKLICDAIPEVCIREKVEVDYYDLAEDMTPSFKHSLNEGERVYLIDYYGQIVSDSWVKDNGYLLEDAIMDYSHSYYKSPIKGIPTIYTCRKYFGVPDGAFLYIDRILDENLEEDASYDRMIHILGRYEKSGEEFYDNYRQNEELISNLPIKKMSKLTANILRSIDYDRVRKCRTDNFKYLKERLDGVNRLKPENGTYMYPLLVSDGERVREALNKKKIYIPILWPFTLANFWQGDIAYNFARNIIPIPIDQRYSQQDMEMVVNSVLEIIE